MKITLIFMICIISHVSIFNLAKTRLIKHLGNRYHHAHEKQTKPKKFRLKITNPQENNSQDLKMIKK